VGGAEFHIGASIGISLYPRDASDVDALLKHADAAMYQAKSSDRSSFTVYERPSADSLDRLSMSARLRRALAADELVLHYQPIFALSTGRLAAVEALIRWQDPERGLLLPGAFIPIAEETGLIEQIGEWVLTTACAQLRDWRSEGLETHVNINVSPRQLRRTQFARQVVRALERHGIDPEALTLEITETTAMRDPERVEPMLAQLHRTGVRLALDDFGSGHSSLARLREMPFDQLKIDRRFLRDVPERGDAASMVTAIVRLARALGMLAVAEGVETPAQRRFLEERDCPLAQGFHLGRPMTAVEVAAQLAAEEPLPQPGMIGPDGGALQVDRP
jgi:EAL domain-containing protein (putative c-di-GMP-specific phosphodiesterase class I)